MAKRPWFTDPRTGTLPLPITIEGWVCFGVFLASILATGLSHSDLVWPLRMCLGAGYFGLSLVKSDRGG